MLQRIVNYSFLTALALTPEASAKDPPPFRTGCAPFCQATTCSADRGNKNAGIFLANGPAAGDARGANSDDTFAGPINLAQDIPYFGSSYNGLCPSSNGLITFGAGFSGFTSMSFPLSGDNWHTLFSPFWSDFNPGIDGDWFYRELASAADLNAASTMVTSSYNIPGFQASGGFVVTWKKVAFYGGAGSDRRNTVQAVLVHDGNDSFAVFNYGDIEWVTGTASGGDQCTGAGGTPAQAGFNDGNGNYFSIQHSQQNSIIDIEDGTNCGHTGRYIFKIDGATIAPAPTNPPVCYISTEVSGIGEAMLCGLDDVNVMNHGCHCYGYGSTQMDNLGGANTVDTVDAKCREWKALRKCLWKTGGVCHGTTPDTYSVNNGVHSHTDVTTCRGAATAIDQMMLAEINGLMPLNLVTGDPNICYASPGAGDKDSCCGMAPNLVPFSSATHQCTNGTIESTTLCQGSSFDIIYLVDGSGSVGASNFYANIDFLKAFANDMGASSTGNHFSMVQYSHTGRREFDFLDNLAAIEAALDAVVYRGGGTATGNALQNYVLPLAQAGRIGVDKIVLVFTDGFSGDSVPGPAANVQAEGLVIAVGIGSGISVAALNEIATDPDADNVFQSSYGNLDAITQAVGATICGTRSTINDMPYNWAANDCIGGYDVC